MSVMNAMPESSKLIAIGKAKEIYMEEMKKKCGANTPSVLPGILFEEHERSMDKAMGSFDELKKYEDTDLVEKFRAKLAKEIEAKRVEFERMNDGKRREEENARQAEELQEIKKLHTRELHELQEVKAQLSANAKNSEEAKKQFNKGLQEVKDLLNVNNAQLARMEIFNAIKFYTKRMPVKCFLGCNIVLEDGYDYTPALEIFIRHGGQFYRQFQIKGHDICGFVHYPHNFFDNLIKYCYKTDKPEEMIGTLEFMFPDGAPCPWPKQLKPEQLKAGGVPTLAEVSEKKIPKESCLYTMDNQHKRGVEFKLIINFKENANKYKEMTKFVLDM